MDLVDKVDVLDKNKAQNHRPRCPLSPLRPPILKSPLTLLWFSLLWRAAYLIANWHLLLRHLSAKAALLSAFTAFVKAPANMALSE